MNFFKIFFATLFSIIICTLIIIPISLGVIIGALGMSVTSAEQPKSESVLVIDLNEQIVDTPDTNPLAIFDLATMSIGGKLTTLDVISAIEAAAMDDNIKGIYIRPFAYSAIPMATLEEIRDEVEKFKQSGKFVIAFADTYSQGGYFLSSVADKVYLQPQGMVIWQGIAANTMYYKELLDKLDINVEIFRPEKCLYKSAVEPLIRTDMSPENREQSTYLVESLWSTITDDVAKSRLTTTSLLNHYANHLTTFIAEQARVVGLVDELIYEDQIEPVFEQLGVKLNSKKQANRVTLSQYIAYRDLFQTTKETNNEVAVIYAEGTIVDGEGQIGEVGGDALAKLIQRTRTDKSVKSVVLRVNSPGGSALASDVVWREMELLREQKPVVVSMGAYAASGGYYISAPADIIVANRLTITGSIGVYGVMMDTQEALSTKLGVTSDSAMSNSSADFMRRSRALNPTERVVMKRSVDQVYDRFTSLVSSGRNLSSERVAQLAQGRVWSGEEAHNLGLVDAMGGLKMAILLAAEKGGVADNFKIVEKSLLPEGWDAIFASVSNKISSPFDSYSEIIDQLKPYNGVMMFSPLRVE